MAEIEFLGTGTSTGVPELLCNCKVCRSADSHDKRLRTSAVIRYKGKNILIDCGPDFRAQMLRASEKSIDAVLLTHIHNDHVGGLDDLRVYCRGGRIIQVYAKDDVVRGCKERLPYFFLEHLYPGVATLHFNTISDKSFNVGDIEIQPIEVMHYKLPILGYKIGPIAYITDCKTISESAINILKDVPVLVVNALRFEEHISHMSLNETLDLIKKINPGQSYLIHMSHDIGLHAETSRLLPENVHLAYDGLIVKV